MVLCQVLHISAIVKGLKRRVKPSEIYCQKIVVICQDPTQKKFFAKQSSLQNNQQNLFQLRQT